MPTEVYLVKVGMTMTEGMVSEWFVPDGQKVEKGDLLYALETEKVNMDIDAETCGTLKHLVETGVNMEPGDIVGYIFAAGEQIPDDLKSSFTGKGIVKTEEQEEYKIEPLSKPANSSVKAGQENPSPGQGKGQIKASPLARRLATEKGIDISEVTGTGPRGRITKEDVESFKAAPASPASTPESAAKSTIGEDTLVPITGMRRTIARRMHSSLQNSAQLTMNMEVGMDEAVRLREQLVREWQKESIKPTYTDLVVVAVAKSLSEHPLMNSQLKESNIVLMGDIHIGIAVALSEGLVVPVVRHAEQMSLKELVMGTARLARAAKEGSLGLDDYSGGTFTVSALGMYGVDSFTPILNEPQAGILGVNRIYEGIAFRGEEPVKCQRMILSLTWDHRVLDGAPAAEFLSTIKEYLEQPYRLLVR